MNKIMDRTAREHVVVTGRWPIKDGRVTNTVYPIKFMVAMGSLSEGFHFYGPFTDSKNAERWAYDNLKRGTDYKVYSIFDVKDGG